MPRINKTKLVGYSAENMYRLVNDVESYPAFLPWCRTARVLRRDDDSLDASIEMAKGALRKTFTTRNRLTPHRTIELSLLDGPFRRLDGRWQFEPLDDDACRVTFGLEFEFSSRLLSVTVGPLFSQLSNSMVDAFSRRARDIYG